MRSEKALWGTLKKHVPAGHWFRHEDKRGAVPDVSYAFRWERKRYNGWIELKECEPHRRLAFDIGLMSHQKTWAEQRGLAGGDCWLLVQLDAYYWYYWSDILELDLTDMTLADHRRESRYKVQSLSTDNIVFVLTKLNKISDIPI